MYIFMSICHLENVPGIPQCEELCTTSSKISIIIGREKNEQDISMPTTQILATTARFKKAVDDHCIEYVTSHSCDYIYPRCMDGWIDEWMWIDGWGEGGRDGVRGGEMDGGRDGRIEWLMDGGIDGGLSGWRDEWRQRWMDGWMDL